MHVYKQYIFILISVSIINSGNARATNENSVQQDRSRSEDQQLEDSYDAQRYRRHPQNAKKKWDDIQKREAFDNSDEASIQVILDPRAKKAVAVVENNAEGQATYDLTDDNSAEIDQQNAQVVNLVYPGTASRKNHQYVTSSRKRKRNADMQRRRLIRKASDKRIFKDVETVQKRKTDPVKADPSKITTNNCPPQHAQTAKDEPAKNDVKDIKRETEKWSQGQLDALSASLTKVRENTEEIDNLKNILSEMGLLDNARKREISENMEKDDVKRSADEPESLEIKRDDIQKADDEAWLYDVNSAPQEVDKRETDEEDNEEESMDESLEKRKSQELGSDIQKNDDLSAKELTANEEIGNREKRQDSENVQSENSSDLNENADEVDTTKEKRKNSDEEEYEKKMESQIQAKIDAIKEKVKREISSQESVRSKRDLNPDSKVMKGNKECKESNKKDKKEIKDKDIQKREIDLKSVKLIPNSLEPMPKSSTKMESKLNSDTSLKLNSEQSKLNPDSSLKIGSISRLDQTDLSSDLSSNSKLNPDSISKIDSNFSPNLKLDQTKLNLDTSSNLDSNIDLNAKLDQSKMSPDASLNPNAEQVQINPEQSPNLVQTAEDNSKLIVRRKRANGAPEKMIYRPFQADENQNSEEDTEFDDNGYDGRIYLDKRELDGDEDDYYEPRNRKYNYYYPENRRRRSFEDYDTAQTHSGGDASRKALLKRKLLPVGREKRRNSVGNQEKQTKEQENDVDDSENEYFGPLPASYNGELTRYKRVKRVVGNT